MHYYFILHTDYDKILIEDCISNDPGFAWRTTMKIPAQAELLRIYIGENDKYKGKPLYEVIVDRAREEKLAGATVLRGLLEFGAHSRMHTHKILRLSEDLPLVIEIVDYPEKIAQFAPLLDDMIEEGYVTLEKVNVIAYRVGDDKKDA